MKEEKNISHLEHEKIKNDIASIKDKFSLFTNIILFVLALQVAGVIYSGISSQNNISEFLEIKEKQFNQIMVNSNQNPDIKLDSEDIVKVKLINNFRNKTRYALTFSVGVNNFGKTPAEKTVLKVSLPKWLETDFHSKKDLSYPYEMWTSAKEGHYIPPSAIRKSLVVIPVKERSFKRAKNEKQFNIKIELYSEYGLEDEEVYLVKVENPLTH